MKTTRVTFICRLSLYVTQLYAVYVFWWRPFFANHIWYLLLIIATSYFPICHRASCWDAQTWHLLYLVITSISIVKVIMLQCCSSAANASLYIWKVCPILPCNKTCLIKCIMTDHWQHQSYFKSAEAGFFLHCTMMNASGAMCKVEQNSHLWVSNITMVHWKQIKVYVQCTSIFENVKKSCGLKDNQIKVIFSDNLSKYPIKICWIAAFYWMMHGQPCAWEQPTMNLSKPCKSLSDGVHLQVIIFSCIGV